MEISIKRKLHCFKFAWIQGTKKSRVTPYAGLQNTHMHTESKHWPGTNISQKQIKNDFSEERTGEIVFPSCAGDQSHHRLGKSCKLQRTRTGIATLFLLDSDSKSKFLDQKAEEPKGK